MSVESLVRAGVFTTCFLVAGRAGAACPADDYESCGAGCFAACDASYAKVSATVAAAANDDTVRVPVGSATWSNELAMSKGLHLVGAGIGMTVITSAIDDPYGLHLIRYTPANPAADEAFELSGFSFDGAYKSGILAISSGSSTLALSKIRVHDNAFSNANSRAISLPGLEFGVFCANQFQDNYIAISAIGSEQAGWSYPLMLGGAHYPFFEDNTFTQTIPRGGFIVESGRGGRLVFRHNKIVDYGGNGGEVFDAHGVNGTYPTDHGTVACEYYANQIGLSASSRILNQRGGKMIFANNTVSGASGNITLTEYQGWSYCSADGYPKPEQISESYYWNDAGEGGAIDPSLCCSSSDCGCAGGQKCSPAQYDDTYIQSNRDYFIVPSGLEANKPSTCTSGALYGATDTGNLFECNPNDTWQPKYTPYPYPHPLGCGGGAGGADGGGAGGGAGSGSVGVGGAGATGNGGASSGATSGGGGKNSGGSGAKKSSDSDGGCGCRLTRRAWEREYWALALLAILSISLRRRRLMETRTNGTDCTDHEAQACN